MEISLRTLSTIRGPLLSSDTHLDVLYRYADSDSTGAGLGPFRPIEVTQVTVDTNHLWNARTSWSIGARTLIEARSGGYSSQGSTDPQPPNSRLGPPAVVNRGTASVNSVEFGDSDRSRADVAVSVIRFEEIASQPHDLKVGFEFETTTATDRRGRNGGMFFTPLPNPMFRLAHIWDGEADEATSRRGTLYLRDQWNVHDRVTLNLGLRVNFNRAAVPEQGTIFSTNPVSPRAGVAWAATADNATVIRAHYGRYHDSILTRKIGDLDTSDQSPFITSVELPDGALIEVFRSPPQAEQTTVHDGIQHSYVDQYTVGIERELLPDVTMQIQYVRRNFEQFMGIVTTNTDWAPESIRDPGPDGDLGTDDDGGLITVFRPSIGLGGHQFLYTNPQGAFRTYDAIQLIGTKRYSHNWQMQASYTWSSSRATVGNLFGTNAGLKDLSSNNSAVESGVFRSPNGLVNAEGEAPWTISELKLIGNLPSASLGRR